MSRADRVNDGKVPGFQKNASGFSIVEMDAMDVRDGCHA